MSVHSHFVRFVPRMARKPSTVQQPLRCCFYHKQANCSGAWYSSWVSRDTFCPMEFDMGVWLGIDFAATKNLILILEWAERTEDLLRPGSCDGLRPEAKISHSKHRGCCVFGLLHQWDFLAWLTVISPEVRAGSRICTRLTRQAGSGVAGSADSCHF